MINWRVFNPPWILSFIIITINNSYKLYKLIGFAILFPHMHVLWHWPHSLPLACLLLAWAVQLLFRFLLRMTTPCSFLGGRVWSTPLLMSILINIKVTNTFIYLLVCSSIDIHICPSVPRFPLNSLKWAGVRWSKKSLESQVSRDKTAQALISVLVRNSCWVDIHFWPSDTMFSRNPSLSLQVIQVEKVVGLENLTL